MSGWNHSLCDDCWYARNPDRQAVRLVNPDMLVCCACGTLTDSGIFVRAAPASYDYCAHPEEPE